MANFNLRKFTDPDWLGTISPARLISFIDPWRPYLASRGFNLPPAGHTSIDCAALAGVLMAPDAAAPTEMIDALYYVHETSSTEDMEELQAKIALRGITILDDPETSPSDYAIAVWHADPTIVQERHAEALARRQQQFDYFAGRRGRGRSFPALTDAQRLQIEAMFDNWFADHKRGRGCRLFIFRHPPNVWLLVRHGKSMRREASHRDDGTSKTEFYRPQQHDVLIYDEVNDEIGVHAETKGEKNLYLRTIGRILFGNEDYFPSAPKYTLAPLVNYGAAAMNCADIDGIEYVKLVEYRQYWGGEHKESEVRRATDIFAALAARGAGTMMAGTPSAAVFRVKFDDSPKERRVVIRTPASARYERNEDSELVEQWLRARGYLLQRPPGEDVDEADTPEILEDTR
jgi:hypothetical protein